MNYRNELIDAKRSEGTYGVFAALAFLYLAAETQGWWIAVDLTLMVMFLGFAFMDFRRARQIRKAA